MSSLIDFFHFSRKSAEIPPDRTDLRVIVLNQTNLDWSSRDTQYTKGFCLNAYVKRACDLYAVRLSSVDPIVYAENGDDISDKANPFTELMDNPNPYQTRRDLFHLIGLYIGIYGEAFIYPKRNALGYDGLYVIDPKILTEVKDSTDLLNPVRYWQVSGIIDGKNQLLPEELIHIKLPDPDMNNVRGMSPMRSCAKSIEMQNVIREWNIQTTRNGAKPSMVINSEDYINGDDLEQMKTDLRNGYQGADNAGAAMILPKGLTASQMGMTAVEMDYQQGMVVAAREIAIAYGIPPEMLADNANKTYSNAQEASREVVVNTIRPLLDLVYQAIWGFFKNKPIASGIGEYTYDVEQLTDFMGVQTELYTALQQASFLTANDKRQKLGYEPIDNPLADELMMSMTDIPMSEFTAEPSLDPGRTDPEKDDLKVLLDGLTS